MHLKVLINWSRDIKLITVSDLNVVVSQFKFPKRHDVFVMVICHVTGLSQILKWSLLRMILQYNCKLTPNIR